MAGPLAAPLIGAAGSLLGGLFGQSSERRAAKQARKWAIEDQAQQFVRHRAASELAGFNPLATLGFSGAGMVGQTSAGGGNYMGTAIADAAMIAADAVARRSDAGKLSDVQAQNRALNQEVQSLTLRPKIGGIYAQRGVTPNLKQALGVGYNGTPSSSNSSGLPSAGRGGRSGTTPAAGDLPPLLDVDPLDPRRKVENKDVPSGPGFMLIDSPWFGRYYFPTLDGDEPLDLLDAPSVAVAIPQLGYKGGEHISSGGLTTISDRKRYLAYKQRGQEYLRRRSLEAQHSAGDPFASFRAANSDTDAKRAGF